MLFSSELKWWGEKEKLGHPHNGLDLRFYEAPDGTIKTIDEDTKIPIIYDGRIVKVIKDFLGFTIFASHEIYMEGSQLFTIYGHVLQSPDISFGKPLREGARIATLAGPSTRNVPSHLHISVVLIPRALPKEALSWKLLNENKTVRFLDPREIITPPILPLT